MLTPLLSTSTYSFHFGTATPATLVAKARECGYAALALTDRNGFYGLPAFAEACEECGLRPIFGVELVYCGGRAVLIVENKSGFSRASHILTEKAEADFGRGDEEYDARESLLSDSDGLSIISDDLVLLEKAGGRKGFYAMLSPCNRQSWRKLLNLRCPPAATAEARFIDPSDRATQSLLVAIGQKKTIGDVKDDELASPAAFLLPRLKMESIYADIPKALETNEAIVDRISLFKLFNGFVFPQYEAGSLKSSQELLRRAVLEGASRRYGGVVGAVQTRIERELSVIAEKGFSDYFLVVRDIVRKASRTCGRGSAAASVVSYCLGITDVDPIRHNLYFDRFLNPGREDPPDIDVDFAWDERDGILAEVIAQYGEDRAARVANHVCFQPRSALRETARAYGMPDGEIAAFEKNSLVDAEAALAGSDAVWKDIAALSSRIVGFPSHLGVHSGGVIIAPGGLADHVPIEKTNSGIRIVQWDKEGVEQAGLVKIDLLGNRSLAVVRDALANLRENDCGIDESTWNPIDDAATEELLARGDTMGVFYVESPAMRLLQKKTSRGDFSHLVIHSSIIRPAANRYIDEYVDRLNGKPYPPLHPLLAGLFDESFGIMCYQEDVCKAAVALAGFTSAEADGIRKVLSKKDVTTRLAAYRKKFFAGAKSNGVDNGTVEDVWRMIESFSGYSFIKAHSASYAMLSFKSAYLRRHFPAEFMAAVISNRGGFYSTLAYVSESRRMGLSVLPPDVNKSEFRCRGSGATLRFGLGMIGSLGEAAAFRILEERRRGGPYSSVDDFARRTEPSRDEAEALVGSGALDALSAGSPPWGDSGGRPNRPRALMRILSILAASEGETACHRDLFESETPFKSFAADKKGESSRRIMESEMRYLGTTLKAHPLALWPKLLDRPRTLAKDLPNLVGRRVAVIGWPITAKAVLTSGAETMEFISFEDETALYETVLFPKEYKRYRHLLFEDRPLIVSGTVKTDRSAVTLTIASLRRA